MGVRIAVKARPWLVLGLGLCILAPEVVLAEAVENKGLAIVAEADRRDTGFNNSTANITMVITTSSGGQIEREMRQMTLELEDDGDKSIIVLDRPPDLKGTAILTFTHKLGSDDQWLYLPALKRVKRISSADKSGPFMGSEFAYEDFASQEIEKYRYKYLRDETLAGKACFVVERIPVDKKSGYTRQVTWFDQEEYRLLRVDFYDRKGDLLKTMLLQDYEQYLEQYWRPGKLSMENHQTSKSTTLTYTDYRFKMDLTDSDFNRSALSRIR